MDKEWTPEQEAVKQHFIESRGAWKWSPMWDTILELDAPIVDAYADYSSVAEKREVLDIKMRKLICIAIDSVTGCLNANGLKNHMKHSLQLGISVREILETLEITSTVGICCYELAMPILYEACASRGTDLKTIPMDERRQELKKSYMDSHNGEWSQEREDILRLDPDYFETFSRFENVPWTTGTLSRKEKELIYVAVHAAPVTLHAEELKIHIGRALDEGATWQEIAEVIQIVSTLGIHAITMGVPILKEAIEEVQGTGK